MREMYALKSEFDPETLLGRGNLFGRGKGEQA
jgi:hypothetical protein